MSANTKIYGLISDYNAVRYKNKVCMHPGCGKPPINSHVLSKSWIRKYANNETIQLKTIEYGPFENVKHKEKRKYYKPCDLDKVSTFDGFCNKHDTSLFHELDNYDGVITSKIALLIHYRIICYGFNVIQLQLKQDEFLRNIELVGPSGKKAREIARKSKNGFYMRRLKLAEEDYLERKSRCEKMIYNNDPKINYVYCEGGMTNPLSFGRAGIFLHQFSRSRLPLRFMPQMPYITYSTITDGKTCGLIFTYLPQDLDAYSNDLDIFINHPDFKKRLEILLYSQSDCCILSKNHSNSYDSTIKNIVDYYR